MAEQSYEKRIDAAAAELNAAVQKRDAQYPGSDEWEAGNATVQKWVRVIEDLRAASA